MFKVKIYTVGRLKEPWLQEAIAEYEKRLSKELKIDWILAKNNSELSAKINRDPPWIALDVKGEQTDSPGFSKQLKTLLQTHGSRLNFLIGGPEGIEKALLDKSIWRWSLSRLTLTHQMVRLILIEQIYRALQIDGGTSYHKSSMGKC